MPSRRAAFGCDENAPASARWGDAVPTSLSASQDKPGEPRQMPVDCSLQSHCEAGPFQDDRARLPYTINTEGAFEATCRSFLAVAFGVLLPVSQLSLPSLSVFLIQFDISTHAAAAEEERNEENRNDL